VGPGWVLQPEAVSTERSRDRGRSVLGTCDPSCPTAVRLLLVSRGRALMPTFGLHFRILRAAADPRTDEGDWAIAAKLKPRAQTLQERFGFLDPESPMPTHDCIVKWLKNSIDALVADLFPPEWTPADIRSQQKQVEKTRPRPKQNWPKGSAPTGSATTRQRSRTGRPMEPEDCHPGRISRLGCLRSAVMMDLPH
jgi:hypothetical protein